MPNQTIDELKVLPHSIEAEQSVLGGLMLDNGAWDRIIGRICETDFYRTEHKLIFRVISELVKNNQCFDPLILGEKLKGNINETYLFELEKNVPSTTNIKDYCDFVRKKSQQRQLIKLGQQIIDESSQFDIDPVLIAQSKITKLESFKSNPIKSKKLNAVDIQELLQQEFKPRELILSPWLNSQSLSMIHAHRGVGKTHLSLGVSYAVASGSYFLGWQADKPRGVLLVDGEMPGFFLRERIQNIILAADKEATAPLIFLTPDMQQNGMPDLATPKGQEQVEQFITDKIELIIVDNLSCLVRSGKENEGESWLPIQDWILKLRAKGKSVILIHHSNKQGLQRGTSRREDILDVVISLKRPHDYSPDMGALFEVHFEKARHLYGKDITPFEARLTTDNEGKQRWFTRTIEQSTSDKVITLFNEGLSQTEIADELNIHKSNVSRHLKNAKENNLLKNRSTL